MSDWLENLKAGDEVALFEGYSSVVSRIVKVDRVTATQIVVGHSRFRKRDGYAPGDAWLRARIGEPTAQYRAVLEARDLREKLKAALASPKTSLDVLRAMAAQLPDTQDAG